jgi:peptidoglycan/xylan/chitin deacetylase (PgdA/CDA1 family)
MSSAVAMKRSLKNFLGRITFASHLNRVLLSNVAVIVAFHRVQDTWDPNGLTISRSMFEQHCRFFIRHFRVIPLRDLVEKLERRQDVSRHLAITLDDGYRDNFENAAPVLEQLSLPATFFLVSRWIGSEMVPWWDREQGVRHPWMTWDQVRSLHRMGFDIGAHTRTHIDLGRDTGRGAREEILGSRLELENHLSTPVDLFAFPYGQRDNFADANRDLVKAAGFRCCCSCFGGVNRPGQDPFNLARIPISPRFATPHQFGLEVALGRSVVSSR